MSADLSYSQDGSARCGFCGHTTAPAWTLSGSGPASAGRADLPRTKVAEIERFAPVGVLTPSEHLVYGLVVPQARWERRIRWGAFLGVLLSLVFLAALPGILGIFVGPIIHLADYYLESSDGCAWTQYSTLTNSGNRAGIANVVLFVDHQPWSSWNLTVPAHTTAQEYEPVNVPSCTAHTYGIGLASVQAA